MLNFSNFLNKVKEHYYGRDMRFELNSNNCKYLISLQKHPKIFKQEDEMYLGIIEALGLNGLQIAAEYIRRHFKKHSAANITLNRKKLIMSKINAATSVKEDLSLVKRWEILHKLINDKIWFLSVDKYWRTSIDHVFYFLLRHKSFEMLNSPKTIFDRRLDMLCKTLELCEVRKELLRLLYITEYNEAIDDLFNKLCVNRRINYAALSILINYPEEKILEAVSSERGLRDLGIVGEGDLELPEEIRKYLKGLGTDNFMDIYATIDKKTPMPLEKFERQNEAKFIIDLISIHENERPLHFLLYGMEGTGKTELARTIAANANCELLDIGREVKKKVFEGRENITNSIAKFRSRALNMAEIVLRNRKNVVLLVDEADVLLNGFEKGTLNQMLEDMRLPVIWISNSLLFTQRSTMRRFNYSIEFKANSPSMRQKLWENVVEK